MKITIRRLAPVVAAAAAATALAAAPVAGATSNPSECRQGTSHTLCQKQGHASLQAEPAIRAPLRQPIPVWAIG